MTTGSFMKTGSFLPTGSFLLALAAGLARPVSGDVPADPSKGKGGETGVLSSQKIEVGGVERSYRLVAPRGRKKAAPLVYVFHGRGGDGDGIARYSGFETLANSEDFLAVFPDAIGGEWELRGGERDLAFFDALHARICAQYDVDRNRVFATGMSMGGYFSNFVAAKRSEVIAAIAPHSGGLGALAVTGVDAARKYPVLVIHGDADQIVPVSEGRKTKELYEKAGHEVVYREIEKLGHTWAGQHKITREIWDFFVAHPKGSGDAAKEPGARRGG